MPFINRSTLSYPATSSLPVQTWLDTKDPTTNDFKNFEIGNAWVNEAGHKIWFMVGRTATAGTWIQAASTGTGILTITGNSGGAINPDGSNNINLIGSGTLSISGSNITNTLTISQSGAVSSSFPTDSGTGIPSSGALTIHGGSGITTSASGSTVTITATSSVPLTFVTDSGSATPSSNSITFSGANGLATSASGHIVTITPPPLTLTGNSGGAIGYSSNNWNTVGSGSITIAGAGSTLTTQLTGLTNHNVLLGAGTATITNVAPSATSGIPLVSNGSSADPSFTTATVPGGGTGITTTTAYGVICGGTTATGNFQNAGAGTAGQILVSNGAAALPSWQSVSGSIVQQIRAKSNSPFRTSTVLPAGGTIPQITDGASLISATITPTNTGNFLIFEFSAYVSTSPQNITSFALFEGATAASIYATGKSCTLDAEIYATQWMFYKNPASTSSTTYSVRFGPSGAGITSGVNCTPSGVQAYGGVETISFTITEVAP